MVNGRDQEIYFARPTLRLVINQPFDVTDRVGQYDVVATVKGGGLSGQAGAVKHGIAQALSRYEPALRTAVKRAGFLTRDSRVVERKKYGRAKARKSFQFSKRDARERRGTNTDRRRGRRPQGRSTSFAGTQAQRACRQPNPLPVCQPKSG